VNRTVAARARSARDAVGRLSTRQREVLALMAEGASNIAIARTLSITERAVVRHCSNIYDQLGLRPSGDEHRRVLAVLCYLAGQSLRSVDCETPAWLARRAMTGQPSAAPHLLVTVTLAAAALLSRLGSGLAEPSAAATVATPVRVAVTLMVSVSD
jgi:DNA-binding CsgD family transcriptional regulator